MEIAIWLSFGVGLLEILLGAIIMGKKRKAAIGLVIVGALFLIAGIALSITLYQLDQQSYRDAISVQLSQQGYNVKNVENGNYTYNGHYYDSNPDGWNAYVSRKGAPNCAGNISIVISGKTMTIVDDLPC